jgi:hypothetical protein
MFGAAKWQAAGCRSFRKYLAKAQLALAAEIEPTKNRRNLHF